MPDSIENRNLRRVSQFQDTTDLQLHDGVVAGIRAAREAVAERFLSELTPWLARRYLSDREPTAYTDAATDAVMAYLQHPQRFEADRADLRSFLGVLADRAYRKARAERIRRAKREVSTAIDDDWLDELSHGPVGRSLTYEIPEDDGAAQLAVRQASVTHVRRQIQSRMSSDQERALLALILRGEHRTAVYADVLGLTSAHKLVQRRIVKTHKDRLRLWLRRLGPHVDHRALSA